MPLAVVGSNVVVEVNGKKVRGRQYPWGVAEGTSAQSVGFCRTGPVESCSNSFQDCIKDRVVFPLPANLLGTRAFERLMTSQVHHLHYVWEGVGWHVCPSEWCGACMTFPIHTECITDQGVFTDAWLETFSTDLLK